MFGHFCVRGRLHFTLVRGTVVFSLHRARLEHVLEGWGELSPAKLEEGSGAGAPIRPAEPARALVHHGDGNMATKYIGRDHFSRGHRVSSAAMGTAVQARATGRSRRAGCHGNGTAPVLAGMKSEPFKVIAQDGHQRLVERVPAQSRRQVAHDQFLPSGTWRLRCHPSQRQLEPTSYIINMIPGFVHCSTGSVSAAARFKRGPGALRSHAQGHAQSTPT